MRSEGLVECLRLETHLPARFRVPRLGVPGGEGVHYIEFLLRAEIEVIHRKVPRELLRLRGVDRRRCCEAALRLARVRAGGERLRTHQVVLD